MQSKNIEFNEGCSSSLTKLVKVKIFERKYEIFGSVLKWVWNSNREEEAGGMNGDHCT